MDAGKDIREIYSSALFAVNPAQLMRGHSGLIKAELVKNKFSQLFVIGFGKASCQMADAGVSAIDHKLLTKGILITKYGHTAIQNPEDKKIRRLDEKETSTSKHLSFSSSQLQNTPIRIYEAGHPIPDENGVKATERIVMLLNKADRDTLVVCLISGGGSALLVSPGNGISLKEKQAVTQLLLNAGADISDLNTVRKHLSKVKGGRLAEIASPAKMITLIISDVIGDNLDIIASGPTSPDSSEFQDALNVIDKYRLHEKIPQNALTTLIKGTKGLIPETPKQDNAIFQNVHNMIIGSNLMALNAAQETARSLGYKTEIISSGISGEAGDVGTWLSEKAKGARNTKKVCLISGGETTVTVKGRGRGGRNTELALGFAKAIQGVRGVTLLSAGTDGTDGPTDAAGAIVNGTTVSRAVNLGLDPDAHLNNNDSYTFFKKLDDLVITGPTGTNVMDVQIMLIEPE
jgi:hydroxypyruvate reductase/glycerate 2-kinase